MSRRAIPARLAAALAVLSVTSAPAAGGAPAGAAPVVLAAAEAARLVEAGGDLRVLDLRKAEEFDASRVAGSARLDLRDWYSRAARAETALERPEAWAAVLRDLGVGSRSRVLLLGGASSAGAGAAWFYLQRLGFANASVVNGGFAALKDALPADRLASGPAAAPAPPQEPFVPTGKPVFAGTALKEDVLALLGPGKAVLVDARSAKEFDGTDVYEGNPRGGRIPGSRNVPHTSLLDEKGAFLPPDQIRAKLEAAGVGPADRVVAYCQGGGRSSALTAALASAGFTSVTNYLGSFGEWSRDPACPVEAERPAPPKAEAK